MASRRVIVGIVLVIVGLLVFAVSLFVGGSASQNVPEESTGAAWQLTPNFIGSGTVTITWSGATSNTTVTMWDCGTGGCGSLTSFTQLSQVANGSGSSGSFSATISAGHTYLVGQSGDPSDVSISYNILALGTLGIVGIVIEVVGVILVILPVRPPPEPEMASTEEPAPAEA